EARSARPIWGERRTRSRSARPSSEPWPTSRSVRVVVMPFWTSTEVLREASTARLATMPAALLPRERGVQPVPERQTELREERGVIHLPVREEVPGVLPNDRPEPILSHASSYVALAPRRCTSPRVHGMRDSIDARRREAQPAPTMG